MAYRILIVDDEIEVITMLQSFLQRRGYQVSYALEGMEAVSRESLSNVDYGQLYREMFGSDVVFIGYPTADGESGHYVPVSSYAYAISSKSENKEGA